MKKSKKSRSTGGAALSKRDRRVAARTEKKQAATKTRVRIIAAGVIVGLAVLVGVGVVVARAVNRPGISVPSMGRTHIPVGTSHTVSYNSNPPTSGPHYDPSAPPGVYDEPIPDGYLIHSLEHGYVIVSYNCDGLAADDCRELVRRLVSVAQDERLWKIIVIPRPGLESRIALTAWTRIDTFDTFERNRIVRFIRAWRDKGPEATLH